MKNIGLTTLLWCMPCVWTSVSDRILLTLTSKDLGLRKVCIKLNIFPFVPASCKSIKLPWLHVKSYAFSSSNKMNTTCSLFAWVFLTVASRDKRWSIVVRLTLPPHCSVDSVPFWWKKSNSTCMHHRIQHRGLPPVDFFTFVRRAAYVWPPSAPHRSVTPQILSMILKCFLFL